MILLLIISSSATRTVNFVGSGTTGAAAGVGLGGKGTTAPDGTGMPSYINRTGRNGATLLAISSLPGVFGFGFSRSNIGVPKVGTEPGRDGIAVRFERGVKFEELGFAEKYSFGGVIGPATEGGLDMKSIIWSISEVLLVIPASGLSSWIGPFLVGVCIKVTSPLDDAFVPSEGGLCGFWIWGSKVGVSKI